LANTDKLENGDVRQAFCCIDSDWSRAVQAPPPMPANHRSGHTHLALIGSKSHAHISARVRARLRVRCHVT